MKSAIVFTYHRPWMGREKMAMEAFLDAATFFGKLAADDVCDEPVFLMGSQGNGMLIVAGDRDRLHDVVLMDDFKKLFYKAGYAVPDMSYEMFLLGDAVQVEMAKWSAIGADLGLM